MVTIPVTSNRLSGQYRFQKEGTDGGDISDKVESTLIPTWPSDDPPKTFRKLWNYFSSLRRLSEYGGVEQESLFPYNLYDRDCNNWVSSVTSSLSSVEEELKSHILILFVDNLIR